MSGIKIETEKVKTTDGIGRKILNFELKERNDLPKKYFNHLTKCYLEKNTHSKYLKIFNKNVIGLNFYVNEIISEEEFQRLLLILKECSKNLRIIMNEIREVQEGWEEKETFLI